ncbi:MAG: preprotein translocase subunit SecA [Bacteroidales bacterium]|jgi:preprotein translocase subunit SecA|nr:preprotein translocase subunit SecA [Bacteroidales bacterium]HKM13125.1 preprotein translocase subunit SecA [Bacteroidales bacterium]HPY21264.1 preprotein translocase subunit SecA [Bacteroidales bacterium]HQA92653.1 preprotein translocase subunit SecA [Bacteroidales bacterium]
MGISSIIRKLFGTKSDRDLKQLKPILNNIHNAYSRIDALSDDDLRSESAAIRAKVLDYVAEDEARVVSIREQLEDVEIAVSEKEKLATELDELIKKIDKKLEEVLNQVLPETFAIVKSTARRFKENPVIRVKATQFDRDLSATHDFVTIKGDIAEWKNSWMAGGNMITWDMVHYDVQLYGGAVLHSGKIAEMATGEGKTLVATLPVFLNALTGKGVHVVTVNDYLSKRDSEWMGPLYMFHGLSVDCIDKHQPNSDARKRAYAADITFGTNNEFGFDYLRDNMALNPEDLVQRKHHFAIVDEVDSVLIDDARTPLIISGPVQRSGDETFIEYKPYVQRLYNEQRTLVNQTLNEAKKLIAAGEIKDKGEILLLRAHKGLPKYAPLIKYLSEPGIKQILQDVQSKIIKAAFTEKDIEQRIITNELFFVIDEHQRSVELTDKGNEVLAKAVGDADFFLMPKLGDEVSKIDQMEISPEEKSQKKDELYSNYSLKAERMHTVDQLLKAYSMFEKDVDYVVIDNKVKIVDESTGRIMEGRRWSDGLHQAVEAKENVKVEAATQTFATITLQNYFRMYHKLSGMTGTAETEAGEFWSIYKLDVVVIPTNRPIIRDDQDDLIYKTKKAKYNAVIAHIGELVRQKRPVLVGTTSVEISEYLSRLLKLHGIDHQVLNAKQHAREAEVVLHAGKPGTVTIATNMAGRGTDIKISDEVKEAGGLAIIGTERHDSRRVDRQLRGRAGRQGDPGSSIFYVSLEDDLMRIFGSDRISKVVDSMGMQEDEALQASMLSNAIERAQKKVEENNFGTRKRLVDYDDVMNSQREVVYTKRRSALTGERIDVDVLNMTTDYCEMFVDSNRHLTYDLFCEELMKVLSIVPDFDEASYEHFNKAQLTEQLQQSVSSVMQRRFDTLIAQTWPVISHVYDTKRMFYQNIQIPVSDGKMVYGILVDLRKAYESKGKELIRAVQKTITLRVIDEYWKNHLRDMDDLKQAVQHAAYEQKDPILVYKGESFELFIKVLEGISKDVLAFLLRSFLFLRTDQQPQEVATEGHTKKTDLSGMRESRPDLLTNTSEPRSNAPARAEKKVGRNDPCPCGSGKKYKNCHGRN